MSYSPRIIVDNIHGLIVFSEYLVFFFFVVRGILFDSEQSYSTCFSIYAWTEIGYLFISYFSFIIKPDDRTKYTEIKVRTVQKFDEQKTNEMLFVVVVVVVVDDESIRVNTYWIEVCNRSEWLARRAYSYYLNCYLDKITRLYERRLRIFFLCFLLFFFFLHCHSRCMADSSFFFSVDLQWAVLHSRFLRASFAQMITTSKQRRKTTTTAMLNIQ